MQAGRPILAIAPTDGDLAEIITKTKAGKLVGFNDKQGLKNILISYFEAYQNNTLISKVVHLDDYHAKNITKNIAGLIHNS